ncbi:MAG: hypothetical protein K2K30_01125 [Alistipes sp.]|nr:hypothetical protein [Alistipes sp.]
MEELAPILWIVIAAGVLLSKSSSKVRKAVRKAAEQIEKQGSEAWPSWDTATQPTRQQGSPAATKAPGSDSTPSAFGPVARQVAAVRESAAHRPKPKRADRTEPTRQQAPAQEPAVHTPTEAAEEFDLRRAIIYSEILKPKFDE